MSRSLWLLDFAARLPCSLVPRMTNAWSRREPELITKIHTGDCARISDHDFGRLELKALLMNMPSAPIAALQR